MRCMVSVVNTELAAYRRPSGWNGPADQMQVCPAVRVRSACGALGNRFRRSALLGKTDS